VAAASEPEPIENAMLQNTADFSMACEMKRERLHEDMSTMGWGFIGFRPKAAFATYTKV
jgi:hypothetical protein